MGLLFFAVGAALSYALPYFASVAGISSSLGAVTSPVYLGLMFGGFGALDAVMRPAFDWLFDKNTVQTQTTQPPVIIRETAPALAPQIHIQQNAPQIVVDNDKTRDDFTKRLENERQSQTLTLVKNER